MTDFLLQFPCPGQFCSKSNIITWEHCDCGGQIYVSVQGDLVCKQCWEKDFIQKWRFHCMSETHGSEYVGFSSLHDLQQAIVYVTYTLENQANYDYLAMLEMMEANIKKRWKK